VIVEHSNTINNFKLPEINFIRSLIMRLETSFLYRRADYFVGCSKGVSDNVARFFGVSSNKVVTIYNPLHTRTGSIRHEEIELTASIAALPKPILLSVGRLVESKRFSDLIKAFSNLRRGSLVILGEGPQRDQLVQLCKDLSIGDRVCIPGYIARHEEIFKLADLYVSASISEAYPLTFIEAYAVGLPVVARDCDYGPREIITDGRPGKLVRSLSVDALTSAVEECLAMQNHAVPRVTVDLGENNPRYVAQRYRQLFAQKN
jgi:glycosyltransferase involved in cell wall biosynthesis